MSACLAMSTQPRYMSDCEIRLAKDWYNDDGIEVEEIARRLRRNPSSVWRNLGIDETVSRGVGRKVALSEKDKDRLVKLTGKMVKKANVRYMVTLKMLQAEFEPKVCLRVLQEALHERKLWFRKLRRKPLLTDKDVADRYAFAKKFRNRKKAWWRRYIKAHIDNHAVKVPTNGEARNMLAAKRVHGTYRVPGNSLKKEHVKADSKLRLNTGARSVLIAGGVCVCGGKVVMWHVVGKQWCGNEAVAMYSVLSAALKKQYPTQRSFRVLEDNDPSGYQTKKAVDAKVARHIEKFEIPKRSPELNVMDFFFWSEVERRLRLGEQSWQKSRKESRAQFISRLRRTAKAIPSSLINKAIDDLARRTKLLYKAKGGLFDESKELK